MSEEEPELKCRCGKEIWGNYGDGKWRHWLPGLAVGMSTMCKDGLPIKPVCRWCAAAEVTFEPDPFSSDVRGDDTKVWQCAACAKARADDI